MSDHLDERLRHVVSLRAIVFDMTPLFDLHVQERGQLIGARL